MTESLERTTTQTSESPGSYSPRFFGLSDWLSFALAAIIALTVYLYTLSPEVTLEWSGSYSTGAMYGGPGPPAGFPTWSVYAWAFTKILRFSNIAWRLAVSSAVAGASTCGVIALMVSRGSAMLLGSTRDFRRLIPREERWLRLVCGMVAGLGFGFHGLFWSFSVIVESVALGLLLMSIVLCLLLRWAFAPRQTRFLYAAACLYGLTLTVQLSLASLAAGLPFLVLFVKPSVGRDLSVVITAGLGAAFCAFKLGWLSDVVEVGGQFYGLQSTYLVLAIIYAIVAIVLIIRSRRLCTRWRTVLVLVLLAFCGLSFYLYIAVASMTNPPLNWGYARTVEGFAHMVGRGQYEQLNPVDFLGDPGRYFAGIWLYWIGTIHTVGWIYLVPTIVPFFFLRKIRGRARGWMFGLATSFLALSFFMVAMLNPPADLGDWSRMGVYSLASHLVLTVWAGYGLAFLGTIAARERQTPPPFDPVRDRHLGWCLKTCRGYSAGVYAFQSGNYSTVTNLCNALLSVQENGTYAKGALRDLKAAAESALIGADPRFLPDASVLGFNAYERIDLTKLLSKQVTSAHLDGGLK